MFSTQAGWMSTMEGTRVLCPTPSPAVPWVALDQAINPVTDQVPVPVHVRALAHVTPVTLTPTYVKPIVSARDQAPSPASVKAPDHVMAQDPDHVQTKDHVQVQTKDPPFPHFLTASSLKGHHSLLSLMPLTPLPQASLLSQTSSAKCLYILPGCCWFATAVLPISSWWRRSHQCENGLCVGRTNPWRRAYSA